MVIRNDSMKGWWKAPVRTLSVPSSTDEVSILKDGVTPDAGNGVPRVIYQTWETHDMPPRMVDAVASLRTANPGFAHHLFDATERRAFLEKHFSDAVIGAYDTLVPNAFKADLWRLCVLYMQGGFYVDIKFVPVNEFSFESLMDKQYWVLDYKHTFPGVNHGVYNAFLISAPGNPTLLAIIRQLVKNVQGRVVGEKSLDITGPGLLGSIIPRDVCNLYWDRRRIVYLNSHDPILMEYEGYRDDCKVAGSIHYSELWPERVYTAQK